MIVVDTSAWVEFLRDTGSDVCERVDEILGGDLATCDAIRMEVLAGARDERHLADLRRLLAGPRSWSHAGRLRGGRCHVPDLPTRR